MITYTLYRVITRTSNIKLINAIWYGDAPQVRKIRKRGTLHIQHELYTPYMTYHMGIIEKGLQITEKKDYR